MLLHVGDIEKFEGKDFSVMGKVVKVDAINNIIYIDDGTGVLGIPTERLYAVGDYVWAYMRKIMKEDGEVEYITHSITKIEPFEEGGIERYFNSHEIVNDVLSNRRTVI